MASIEAIKVVDIFECYSKKEENNFMEIVESQIKALQFDTDYTKFLPKHPAES